MSNVKFHNVSCTNDIDALLCKLTCVIKYAMDRHIPVSRSCPYQRPYWDEQLEQCHRQQKAKRCVWINNGRPRGHEYESHIRRQKKQFSKLLYDKQLAYQQSKFHDAETKLDSRQLWKYLKPLRKSSDSGYHSINVDGVRYSSPDELRLLWSEHYRQLLNDTGQHTFDDEFRGYISGQVNDMFTSYDKHYDNTGVLSQPVTVNEVANACKTMPNSKSAGFDGITKVWRPSPVYMAL